MNINPSLPNPLVGADRARDSVAPVQPTTPPRDALRAQREAAQRLVVPEPERRRAEQALGERVRVMTSAEDARARRALHAYDLVARQDEHDYVTSILGVDEFA
jgi:hypothetical protein